METVIINNCKFLFDKEATANYVTEFNAPCDCAYCRNYYKAVQSVPAVIDFLNTFGVNVNRPEECMEWDTDFEEKTLWYNVWYSVSGEAEQSVTVRLSPDATAEISPPDGRSPNTWHDDNYFLICLDMHLPWVMDEDIDQLRVPEKKSILKRVADLFKR